MTLFPQENTAGSEAVPFDGDLVDAMVTDNLERALRETWTADFASSSSRQLGATFTWLLAVDLHAAVSSLEAVIFLLLFLLFFSLPSFLSNSE